MDVLSREHETMDHDDPNHAVYVIRRLHEIANVPLSEKAQETMRRLEAGECPDRIEQEIGNFWWDDDSLFGEQGRLRNLTHKLLPPSIDGGLHDM